MSEERAREAAGEKRETETGREDNKVRGDLWVSRLNAEHEADMIRGKVRNTQGRE